MNTPKNENNNLSGVKRIAALVVLAMAFVALASASPISMTVDGIDFSKGGKIQFSADGKVISEYAGPIDIKLDGVRYQAFCVDLFASIGLETIAVNPFSPYTVNNAARAAWLFATQFGTITSAVAGEAMQLAIWDIIHDGGDGLSAGRIKASTSIGTPSLVVTAANQYLTMSVGHTSGLASVYISVNGASDKQSLMSNYLGIGKWDPPVDNSAVPEPAGLTLSALGLAFLGVATYWKRRTAR